MLKKIITLFVYLCIKSCTSSIEIDIDQFNKTSYSIHIGDKSYMCETKKPPVSHGWAYECDIVENRSRNLRK